MGRHRHRVTFHELDRLAPFDASDSFGQDTIGSHNTGQGTDHDDSVIRTRKSFRFEDIYDTPARGGPRAPLRQMRRGISGKLQAWLGLQPYEHYHKPPGLYFSLRESEGTLSAPRGV